MFKITDKSIIGADEMILNMGPQHPSTHGVLRLKIITDGETGFLFNGEGQELAERITQLASNNLRLKMRGALREKVRNLYGWQEIIAQYMDVYKSL